MNPIRIALLEDDEGLRESLASLIDATAGFACIAIAATGEEALEKFAAAEADVLVSDINLPGISGIDVVRALKKERPGLQVLMLTVYEDSNLIFAALKAGASGYLLKRDAPAQLIGAVEQVHAGGAPMSPTIARKVVGFFHEAERETEQIESLSQRETQVLDLLSKGYLYKEIADQLGLSMDTVRTYLRRIYEKMHVHSRTDAVTKYLESGRKLH
jgi:DNA-binding NarL/FixJ family response regulator